MFFNSMPGTGMTQASGPRIMLDPSDLGLSK